MLLLALFFLVNILTYSAVKIISCGSVIKVPPHKMWWEIEMKEIKKITT